MKRSPTWLLDSRSNVYSQAGEDGIVGKILDTLPTRDKWCVEFGAWDGLYLSNTRNLIEHKEYSAVMIEGNTSKYSELKKNYTHNPKVHPLNAFVGFDQQTGLDKILGGFPIPKDFDFLSIDIDGNDYHVWNAMSAYKPKLIVIEFNPTISNDVKFVQKADGNISQGCSLAALVPLAKEKGYELVSVLAWNAFFVRSEYFPLFGIDDNSAETLRTDLSLITHIFVGYDGHVFLQGSRRLPWHDMHLRESDIQPLPRFLKKHPSHYNMVEKGLFLLFTNPAKLFRELGRFIKRKTK